jgi:hypothetical protein
MNQSIRNALDSGGCDGSRPPRSAVLEQELVNEEHLAHPCNTTIQYVLDTIYAFPIFYISATNQKGGFLVFSF